MRPWRSVHYQNAKIPLLSAFDRELLLDEASDAHVFAKADYGAVYLICRPHGQDAVAEEPQNGLVMLSR